MTSWPCALVVGLSMGCAVSTRPARSVNLPPAADSKREAPAPSRPTAEAPLEDGVVALVIEIDATHAGLCSGSLVAPNLVLTARHCVSRLLQEGALCDEHGASENGPSFGEDYDPTTIDVYAGRPGIRPGRDAAQARGLRILHPRGDVMCNSDIAFLVLDRRLPNARILAMRFERSVGVGESVVAMGFGGGGGPSQRHLDRREGELLAIGPSTSQRFTLGPDEFAMDAASRPGDSGGPAVDARSGDVLGVCSRGDGTFTRVAEYSALAATAFVTAQQPDRVAEPLATRTWGRAVWLSR